METDMHLFIRELLQDNMIKSEPRFKLDHSFRAIDREEYGKYLPELCRWLAAREKNTFSYMTGFYILEKIFPDRPDSVATALLLGGLDQADNVDTGCIFCLLQHVQLPEATDWTPLKNAIRRSRNGIRLDGLKAMRAFPGLDREAFLLEILRRTEDELELGDVVEMLGNCGSVFSIPVLCGRMDKNDPELNSLIQNTLTTISKRLQLPQKLADMLTDPFLWKLKWGGSKESFVGFMDIVSLMAGSGSYTEAQSDELAEIFREELEVDILPFQSFKELRISCPDNNMQEAMENMISGLQSEILLEVALTGTGITESKESQSHDLYMTLTNDYLFTRLRRKISFQDDDF